MARRVFFSFHYQGDILRVGQVRNSWVTQDRTTANFWDSAAWESIKRKGERAVHNWIDEQLKGTSVTVVLIGAQTSNRDHVIYEIKKSHELGKGILGIYIHNLVDLNGEQTAKGSNPLDRIYYESAGKKIYLSKVYPTYDWLRDDGRNNIGRWIEKAANEAGY
ncbi:MAG: TIR domain-containing protein [Thermodesulfobacteriota bacterium]